MSSAKVVSRVKDKDGKTKDTYNNDTILDTRVYNVMFPDGSVCHFTPNIIAENMYSQVDSNDHHTLILKVNLPTIVNQKWLYLYMKSLLSPRLKCLQDLD